MPQSDIATWLKFALQQMAAESYLDNIDLNIPEEVARRLLLGNNREGFPETGFTRFTGTAAQGQAKDFSQRYQIIDHHANDATGFSATLMRDTTTGEYTLSFRSTEYRNQSQGGDYERDGANGLFLTGADGEILTSGFAFGQLAAMEHYYQTTVKTLLPTGAVLNVTGYSLGAHLATVFTELHGLEANPSFSFGRTYTFNGPGRGTFNVALSNEAEEAQRIRQMINTLTQVLLDPDAGLPTPRPPDEQLPVGYILAQNAQQGDQQAGRVFDPFAEGNLANIYSDARYLWAKEVVSAEFGPLSAAAGDISRTDGAFGLITQIVGHATQGDTEYVANSGIHAAETRVYIEDQPNLDGFAGFFGANGDFGTTHSITLLVDSLALQELFQTLSPALERTQIEAIFAASSNDVATGATVGLSGSAEARPLENALDALRRLFLPEPVTKTAADPSTGGFGNLANRNKFYEGIAAVKTAVVGASLTIEPFVELVSIAHELRPTIRFTPNEVIAEAQEVTDRGLAFRYALKALNPFAVIGADYPGLGHTANGQLALFDPATGLGEMTPEYLLDRAAFLEAKIELNLVNEKTSGDTIHYQDYATGFEIATGSIFSIDQEFLFGSEQADTLVGNNEEDHLYGGASADLLSGSGGNDYLQGDSGNDRLEGGTGGDTLNGGLGRDIYVLNHDGLDTIEDSDRQGVVSVNEQLVVGGLRRPGEPAAPFTSLDGQLTFVQSGGNLVINDHITIQNWQAGDLGITLRDLSSLSDGTPPVINYANGQPTVRYDGDATDNTPIFTAAANHEAYGYGGNDVLDFSSGSAAFNHQIFGGEGTDELNGGAGQDRVYGESGSDALGGGGGDDVLIGGDGWDLIRGDLRVDGSLPSGIAGQDVLEGGAGRDFLEGNAGDDVLLGGADDDFLSGDDNEVYTSRPVGDDYLDGGAGADILWGSLGNDVLMGGTENDRLYGDNHTTDRVRYHFVPGAGVVEITPNAGPQFYSTTGGADYLDGGDGDDYLQGDAGDDVLVGGTENDTLYGDDQTIDGVEAGKDLLDGGAGDDLLYGGGEADTLLGGEGNDTLFGDFLDDPTGWDDLLDGGAGDDVLAGGRGDDMLFGGADQDQLLGNEGQDVLDGGGGHDGLQGGAGADVLWGGDGNDQLNGEEGNDTLFGGDGSDTLNGGDGEDVLVGGPGTDTLIGGAGADTYVFSLGDGVESIDDTLGEGNKLVFGPGIKPEDISVGIGSLVVRVGFTGDAVHIQGFDPANPTVPTGIEVFEFADGTMLTQADLVARGFDLVGTAGDDTLNGGQLYRGIYGLDGNDVLTGGAIDNLLNGGSGNDLVFGEAGNDQLFGGTGDDIVRGGDGNDALYGEAGNDSLVGEAGSDVLVGGAGDDQLLGGAGADTYRFNLGDGLDSISDPNAAGEESRVVFGPGITSSSVTLTTNSGQVLVRPGSTFEGVTIGTNGNDVFGPRAVDRFEFADGTAITYAELIARGFDIGGTEFDDFLFGTNVVDRFNGGLGNDRLEGGEGSDSYLFNAGDGVDTVVDTAVSGTGNEVVFGSGIASTDLHLDLAPDQSDPSLKDLLIRVGTNGDAVQLDTFDRNNVLGPRSVETLRFADGSTLTYDQLLARGFDLTGTEGEDQINGTNVVDRIAAGDGADVLRSGLGDDTLDGGAGNDRLFGGQGSDTYVFGPGSGHDTIVEFQGSLDRISMAPGVAPSDVVVTRNNNDLVFSLNGGADRLTVSLYFLGAPLQIEAVQFADGTVWDQTVIENLTRPTITGTGGPDVLTGTSGDDRLAGLGGDDQLTGLAGNDLLDGGTGVDQLTGGLGDDTFVIDDSGDLAIEGVDEGTDTIQSSVTATLPPNVENLTLTGSAAINGTGNDLDNVLTANSAGNVLMGGVGDDTYVIGAGDTVVESVGEGTDTVQAGVNATLGANVENLSLAGSASLTGTGNALDNVLQADGSISVLAGGAGNDTYLMGPNGDDDILVETASGGIDTVMASRDYRLPANIENVTLLDPRIPDFANFSLIPYGSSDQSVAGYGNDLANVLIGGRSNNVLDGGLGADTLIGGAGNDTYVVDNSGDAVVEQANEGTDAVLSSVSYQLPAHVENLTLTGTASINGTGNGLNNDLRGNQAANVLDGGAGDDSLMGFGGADTYLFGRGSGRDVVFDSSAAGEVETIQLAADVTAADVEVYRRGYDLVLVLSGTPDELTLASFFDTGGYDQKQVRFADGTVWNDAELRSRALTVGGTITGTIGDDQFMGSAGHDVLIGDAGNDVLEGGLGNDWLYGDAASQLPFGPQVIGNDSLVGGAGDDVLVDLRGTNVFDGGAGNDALFVGTGQDTILFGRGSGRDSLTLDTNAGDLDVIQMAPDLLPSDVVLTRTVQRSTGVNIFELTISATGDRLTVNVPYVGSNSEMIPQAAVLFADGTRWDLVWGPTAQSSSGPDVLEAAFPATLAGMEGDDLYLFGSSGVPGAYSVVEGPDGGIDTVQSPFDYVLDAQVENLFLAENYTGNAIRGTGNELDNLIIGNTGDNILDGGAGNDILVGGLFRAYEVGLSTTGSDILIGGAGNDVLMADGGNFVFYSISGFEGGEWRDDVVRHADDLFIGGPGNDTYIVHSQEQTLAEFENEGTDTVRSTVSYILGEHLENLELESQIAFDEEGNIVPPPPLNGTGNELDNVLIGSEDANILSGLAGRDTLVGRLGNDTLRGGAGHDTYVFTLGDGIDTIDDIAIAGEGNRIQFGVGVAQSDLALTHDDVARTLTIQVGTSGADRLVLTNFDPTGANGSLVVETLAFADGSEASLTSLLGPTITIFGTANADVLVGTAGNDGIDAGAGDDAVYGNAGDDLILAGEGDDSVTGDEGADTIFGGSGTDYLYGGAGDDVINGDDGHDTLVGDTGHDVLNGGLGNDVLNGGFGDDTLNGEAGNDAFYGGAGNDRLTGGDGDDSFSGDEGADTILGGSGTDYLYGGEGDDILQGDEGNDTLVGETGNDVLTGGAGNDVLNGGAGADRLQGGEGDDSMYVDAADTVVNGGAGYDSVTVLGTEAVTLNATAAQIEFAAGSNGSDIFTAMGSLSNVTFYGGEGNDQLTGGDGNDVLVGQVGNDTLVGGPGDDILNGGDGADVLNGGAGNDAVYAGSGDDLIDSGEGDDSVSGEEGADTIFGGSGIDYLYGGAGDDVINGGDGHDTLVGDVGNDVLNGGAGNDVLNGGAGVDQFFGGDGDDSLYIDAADTVVNGGAGADAVSVLGPDGVTLDATAAEVEFVGGGSGHDIFTAIGSLNRVTFYGGEGNDQLIGGDGHDVLVGQAGEDSLIGGLGDDILTGSEGNDVLIGGAGNDAFYGGLGDDQLSGGEGDDSLAGDEGADSLLGGTGRDYLYGGDADDSLNGEEGNDVLVGNSGNDVLTGGVGDDYLAGGAGNDQYAFARGGGADTIAEDDVTGGNSDRLLFDGTINPLDLVVSRQANNLRLAIYGSSDQVVIENWYAGTAHEVETIQAGNGQSLLSTDVEQLIQAMASFTQQTGLTWDQGIEQRPQEVQTILAASWR